MAHLLYEDLWLEIARHLSHVDAINLTLAFPHLVRLNVLTLQRSSTAFQKLQRNEQFYSKLIRTMEHDNWQCDICGNNNGLQYCECVSIFCTDCAAALLCKCTPGFDHCLQCYMDKRVFHNGAWFLSDTTREDFAAMLVHPCKFGDITEHFCQWKRLRNQ